MTVDPDGEVSWLSDPEPLEGVELEAIGSACFYPHLKSLKKNSLYKEKLYVTKSCYRSA